jgi:hypothetical protein
MSSETISCHHLLQLQLAPLDLALALLALLAPLALLAQQALLALQIL